jgi:hypothetical protein
VRNSLAGAFAVMAPPACGVWVVFWVFSIVRISCRASQHASAGLLLQWLTLVTPHGLRSFGTFIPEVGPGPPLVAMATVSPRRF